MTRFEDLNAGDRLSLCDIAWFIKGYRAGKPDCELDDDHEETLKRVINVLGDKVRADNRSKEETERLSKLLNPTA